jgi:hypothetical protein
MSMADIHHDADYHEGPNTLGIILAVLLILALIIGGWWLFFRGPVDAEPDNTNIELNQELETTSSP